MICPFAPPFCGSNKQFEYVNPLKTGGMVWQVQDVIEIL